MASVSSRSSIWPMIAGISSISLSAILAVLPYLKLVSNSDGTTSLVGWLLTPVVTFTLFGLNFFLETKGMSRSNFISMESYGTILRIVAYLSIPVALFHIWRIATIWSLV